MFQYQYTVPAFTATLTSSSTLTYSSTSSTLYADVSTTYEELLLTTGTYQHTYTESTTTTYTVADYYSTSTNTCDYSVTVSSQSQSGETTNNAFSSTSTYATTHHSTNGTHSITNSTVVVSFIADLQSFETQTCAYTYYTIETASGSTGYASSSVTTYRTTTHDIYGTHSVSYRTFEATLVSTNSSTITQECDYLDASTQSTSVSSDYTNYTGSYSYTTTHDIYSIGIHTVSGRTSEISSSNATVTLSSTRVSETTATSVVNVYGSLRTTVLSSTNHSAYHTRSVVGFSNIPFPPFSNDTEIGYKTNAITLSTLLTKSDIANSYSWASYTLSVTAGDSVGYSRGVYSYTATAVSTEYVSESALSTTINSFDINETSLATTYYSTSFTGSDSNTASETLAIVSLGEKTYITTAYGTSAQYSSSTSYLSTFSSTLNATKLTSFTFADFNTFTTSIGAPSAADRTTGIGIETSTMVFGTTNSAGNPTTITGTFTGSIVSTVSTTSTFPGYSTSSNSFSSSGSRSLYTRYLALHGEILYVPTLTASGTWRLFNAGSTTTSWQNEPTTTTFVTSASAFNSSVTSESAATLQSRSFQQKCNTGVASLSMSPDNISIYQQIPTPMSAVDTMMQNKNNDYALFGLQAYNRAFTSTSQGVSWGAGAFDETFGGSTSTFDYAAVSSMAAPIEDRRIHPRDTISIDTTWTDAFFGSVLPYFTYNTVTRV